MWRDSEEVEIGVEIALDGTPFAALRCTGSFKTQANRGKLLGEPQAC
jgi:hypothetical protein